MGACNPPIAYKALSSEDKIGVLLPCNVIVEENEKEEVEVVMINPLEAMKPVENEILEEFSIEVTNKLQKVLDNI